ncbi:MAG: MATE family efflux transporter [Sarcina sp.]
MENEYYLKEAPMRKSIIKLAIPMMIGMSVGSIYNVINAIFIGMLHNTAMFSAITFGLPVFVVLMAIGNVFGAGGGTFVSRLFGEGNTEKCKKVGGYGFYCSILIGIIIAILAIIFANPITRLLGANAETFLYTKEYVITLFVGGIPIILNFTLEQFVRAEGASKESMYGIIISCVANFIFDPLFILVFKLDVVGAAMAISLANLISVLYYLYFLEFKSTQMRGFLKHFKISIKDRIEIYTVGMGELFQALFLVIVTLLLNNFTIGYGDSVVTAFGIALRLTQVPEFLAMGIVLGLIPLFAYTFSSKNIARFNISVKYTFIFTGIISLGFSIVVYLFRDEVIKLFTDSQGVIGVGLHVLTVMLIASVFNSFTGIFISIFQATGQGIETIIMSILQGGLYIIALVVLNYFYGLEGIIWSMAVCEIIMCFIGSILYIRFKIKMNERKVVKVGIS